MSYVKHVLMIWFGCLGLFGLLSGCSQSPTPDSRGTAVNPTAPKAVKREFDIESGPHSAGKKVLVANGCFHCHTVNLARGPVGGDENIAALMRSQGQGPDLGTTGADPLRTVDWFVAFIRDPKSKGPNARMPSYRTKINEQDLRALAEYLVSLK